MPPLELVLQVNTAIVVIGSGDGEQIDAHQQVGKGQIADIERVNHVGSGRQYSSN